MRLPLPSIGAAALLLCGCAGTGGVPSGSGAAPVGAPKLAVDPWVVSESPPLAGGSQAQEPVRLPDRIALPATYRLMLVDGHMTLVRETDTQALAPSPASLRIVTGEVARGELAYQPALLPQELAAEVAANRESSARMDDALDAVMKRSRELSEQALGLEEQSRKLAALLEAAQARVRELEAGKRDGAKAPTAQADQKGSDN